MKSLLVLALIASIGLTACGGGGESGETDVKNDDGPTIVIDDPVDEVDDGLLHPLLSYGTNGVADSQVNNTSSNYEVVDSTVLSDGTVATLFRDGETPRVVLNSPSGAKVERSITIPTIAMRSTNLRVRAIKRITHGAESQVLVFGEVNRSIPQDDGMGGTVNRTVLTAFVIRYDETLSPHLTNPLTILNANTSGAATLKHMIMNYEVVADQSGSLHIFAAEYTTGINQNTSSKSLMHYRLDVETPSTLSAVLLRSVQSSTETIFIQAASVSEDGAHSIVKFERTVFSPNSVTAWLVDESGNETDVTDLEMAATQIALMGTGEILYLTDGSSGVKSLALLDLNDDTVELISTIQVSDSLHLQYAKMIRIREDVVAIYGEIGTQRSLHFARLDDLDVAIETITLPAFMVGPVMYDIFNAAIFEDRVLVSAYAQEQNEFGLTGPSPIVTLAFE